MPIEPGDTERARELGQRSGQRRRRLVLEEVERELPPLDSPEQVRAGLQVIQRWACAGLIPGTVANASVRAGEVWLKLHEYELDRDRMAGLERRIRELEAELQQAGRKPT